MYIYIYIPNKIKISLLSDIRPEKIINLYSVAWCCSIETGLTNGVKFIVAKSDANVRCDRL